MEILYFGRTEIPDRSDPTPNRTQLRSGLVLEIFGPNRIGLQKFHPEPNQTKITPIVYMYKPRWGRMLALVSRHKRWLFLRC